MQSNNIYEEIRLKYGELVDYRCAMIMDGKQSAMIYIMQEMWDEIIFLRERIADLEADGDDE